jgi:hypothetical protein
VIDQLDDVADFFVGLRLQHFHECMSVQFVGKLLDELATRVSGGLPAIRAELTAPIEMPATHSG